MDTRTIDLDMAERAAASLPPSQLNGYDSLTLDSRNLARCSFLATFPTYKDPFEWLLLANVPGPCFDACTDS